MLYILLARLTDAGQQRMVQDADTFTNVCNEVSVQGAQLLARYAVLGQYDYVLMAEANDAEVMARLSLELGARAGIHIESLQAVTVGFLAEPWEQTASLASTAKEEPEP
jgi:uncharacterized protein with GYD domain